MKPQEIARAPHDAVVGLDAGERVRETAYGRRAAKLARLTALGLAVPPGVALSFDCVRALADGGPMPDLPLDPSRLLVLRSSPEHRAWGGPGAVLNLGICAAALPRLAARIGPAAAQELQRRAIAGFAHAVHGLDPDDFEPPAQALAIFAAQTGQPFPGDPLEQLEAAARAMARAWDAPSARILRRAKGAPEEAGLGLVVQELVLGAGPGLGGAGHVQMVDSRTGAPACLGEFRERSGPARRLTRDERVAAGDEAPSLEELDPGVLAALREAARAAAEGLGDAFRIDFVVDDGRVAVVDAVPVRRNARAAVRIAVDLAERGVIGRSEALLRVDPRSLIEHLHPQIDPSAQRDVFGSGLAASPGAARGRIVFSAEAAQSAAAQGEAAILARIETSPEDIRGMHAAKGVLTVRGGMTSHAAVIARGIGLPCVVGAGELKLDPHKRTLTSADGRIFREGALITLDGTRGEVVAGAPPMIPPELDGAFSAAARLGGRSARPRGARQRRHPRRGAHGARLPRRRARALPHRAHVLRRRAHHGDARDDPRRHRRRAAGGARPAAADAARRTSSRSSRSCAGCR